MKRGASRDLSPTSKRSRSSMGRFDDSSEDDGRRSSRGGSPLSRRYLPPEPIHRIDRDEYGRTVQRGLPPAYKVLCVSNLHSKASDEMVRDALYREFKRFGDASVKVTYDADSERVAYVYFRSTEEAREAKHSKPRILFYDRPVIVDPVYDSPRDYAFPRGRSRSPIDYDRIYRPRSPPVPDIEDHYDPRYERARPPPPHRDYYMEGPLPIRPEDYMYRPHRGRGPHHYGPPHRGGFKPHYGGGGGRGMLESKRDKFPNYLQHVDPEDDPLSTRTLFAGNLEINITEEELRRIFGRYGIVDDIDIKRPPPGTGNAYAFVRFQNLDMAHRAKIELSGQYIGKFQCKIGYGKAMPTNRVWVGGLGPWVSLAQLTQEFDRFGVIKKIDYHKGETHAYILYETLEAAQAAVKEMRGFALGGPDKKKLRTDFAEVSPPAAGQFTGPADYREEWSARAYEEFGGGGGGVGGGEYSGVYIRGRGRGRGWHDRGRGHPRGGYHGDYQRPDYREFEGSVDIAVDGKNHGPEAVENQNGLSSARSLADITRKTTVAWQGSMILKNSSFGTKLHVVEGDPEISDLLQDEKAQPVLKITQRLRLDQPRLDDVSRRINAPSNATILLSLPTNTAPSVPEEQGVQSRPLRNLVAYLKQKEAAGVITLNGGGVLYAFPPCVFSLELLQREVPSLTEETTRDDHLVVVIDRGSAA